MLTTDQQMDFPQHFNQVDLSDVVLRLKTTVEAPEQQKDLASSNRKRTQPEGAPPSTGSERSYFLHKLILCRSPYFKNKLKYQAEGILGFKRSEGGAENLQNKRSCNDPSCLKSTASTASTANTSSELVEHVEECELEAMELLLKSLYKADPELTQEARSNGQLLLQVSLSEGPCI